MTVVRFHSLPDDAVAWRRALEAALPGVVWRDDADPGDPAAVDVALVWKPPPGFFAGMTRLRLVVNLGAGVDALLGRTDLPPVAIARLNDTGMVRLMTSYVVFAVLRYLRDIPQFEAAQRRGEWHYIHPQALGARRVGVLGLGELGGPAAAALAGLGCTVQGWSRSPKDIPGVQCHSGAMAPFLESTDVLVVMLPLTDATRGVIGADALARLPRGAALINVSRGPVVVEDALLAALRSGHLAGATLDVFEQEPLPAGHALWAMDNVLITPHLASITVPEEAAADVAESIRRTAQGLAPLHQVDPARGY